MRQTVEALLPEAEELLGDLIAFPSTPGSEQPAIDYMERRLGELNGSVERVPFPDRFAEDPEYSSPIEGISYEGRHNLRFERPGEGAGRRLLMNAHIDVVPPSEGMESPWKMRREKGRLHGRGACDDKGPLAAVWLALRTLDRLDIRLPGSLIFHVVNEEENGGNGTLAMVRRGERADGCIVMEPSSGRLFTSIRGAVWFRIRFIGTAGHSGRSGPSGSALMMAHRAIDALNAFHADLLAESRTFELFNRYDNPMPLTFGRMTAGNWPAASPSEALLEGVFGFLPNRDRDRICEEIRKVLETKAGLERGEFELDFTYRHDCSVLDPDAELPRSILEAGRKSGFELETAAFPASCDAWFYSRFLDIPTVVLGPGDLAHAHSNREQIGPEEIADAAALLVQTAIDFCR